MEEEAVAVCLPRERSAASGSDRGRGHCRPGWLFSADWLRGQLAGSLTDWHTVNGALSVGLGTGLENTQFKVHVDM